MQGYIERQIKRDILEDLALFPALALIGPRQCGKSVLARTIATNPDLATWLDLENPRARAKLADPQLFFENQASKLICIDEVQILPELFPVLRSEIDRDRRAGRFLLLGSASRELVNRSAESLAGRIAHRELTPFLATEYLPLTPPSMLEGLWRGGFPESALAESGEKSLRWREAYLQSLVERDLPLLGMRIPSVAMERFLSMCAHLQGQTLNLAKLGESLDLSGPAVRSRLEFLEAALLFRLLPSWSGNLKKRLVKAPKLFIRDTGLCTALLGIESAENLLGHPTFGACWEAFGIETLCSSLPGWRASYFRSSGGAEIDLVLEKGLRRLAFEFKASSAPRVTRGFHEAIRDLAPERAYVIGLVDDSYPIAQGVRVSGLRECAAEVAALS